MEANHILDKTTDIFTPNDLVQFIVDLCINRDCEFLFYVFVLVIFALQYIHANFAETARWESRCQLEIRLTHP